MSPRLPLQQLEPPLQEGGGCELRGDARDQERGDHPAHRGRPRGLLQQVEPVASICTIILYHCTTILYLPLSTYLPAAIQAVPAAKTQEFSYLKCSQCIKIQNTNTQNVKSNYIFLDASRLSLNLITGTRQHAKTGDDNKTRSRYSLCMEL